MEPLPEVHLSALARPFLHWLALDDAPDHFDLDAPYQRGSVWTVEQRRALIKSLYMGVPVGAVIVSKLPFRRGTQYAYRIVDGKQRIEAIRSWVNDEFDVPGWWFAPEYIERPGDEVKWSDLTSRGHRRFEIGTQLAGLEFDAENEFLGFGPNGKRLWRQRSDDEILRVEAELYLLVNGGGTAQTDTNMARAAEVARGQ